MNNTLYFESKKKNNSIAQALIVENKLDLSYQDKYEKIFKNNHMLISCHKKYIFVHIFDEMDNKSFKQIIDRFYEKQL